MHQSADTYRDESVPRGSEPAPHELANELTRDRSVVAESSQPQTHAPEIRNAPGLPPVERQVAKSVAMVILGALAIGLMLAAIMLRSTTMTLIGALFVIPFLLMVSAPVWLASTTKQAQDQTVREQRSPSQ